MHLGGPFHLLQTDDKCLVEDSKFSNSQTKLSQTPFLLAPAATSLNLKARLWSSCCWCPTWQAGLRACHSCSKEKSWAWLSRRRSLHSACGGSHGFPGKPCRNQVQQYRLGVRELMMMLVSSLGRLLVKLTIRL